MEHLEKIPEYALGAGMVTAIGVILLQLIKGLFGLNRGWKEYALQMKKERDEALNKKK